MQILNQEEYNKIKHKTPYIYKIEKMGQFLYYFGEKHSFDPDDKQWIKVKRFWYDFIQNTENKKRIVLVEAGKLLISNEMEKEIISEAGGTGLITLLASQSNIEVQCSEPIKKYEMGELEKFFTKEEIEYYYFARVVHQWGRRNNPKPNFNDYIQNYLDRDKKISGWSDFDFSLNNLKIIHKNIFGTDFNQEDTNFFGKIITPIKTETIINKVTRKSGELRNEYISKEIQKYWNDGFSIYIQYGASHAVIHEPFLKEIIKI